MMTFTLSNGIEMPAVGIGTFMMTPAQAEKAVLDALNCGYRMIDTAQAYMNERAVGRAIRKSKVAREDIFLSTKIWASQYLTEGTVEKAWSFWEQTMLTSCLSISPQGISWRVTASWKQHIRRAK